MSCVAMLNLFGCETEIVEACLCCNLYTVGSGFAKEGYGFDGGEMDNVEWQIWREVG